MSSRRKDQLGVVFDLQVCIDDLIEALALQSGVDIQKFRQAVTSLNSTLKGKFSHAFSPSSYDHMGIVESAKQKFTCTTFILQHLIGPFVGLHRFY